jgi:cobalt/nickel transport system permease protein
MQPIHLAIGIVEGFVTAAVATFVWKARPEVLELIAATKPLGQVSLRNVLAALLVLTALTGGVLSWFASANPDGLEWSMFHTSGKEELDSPEKGLHPLLAEVQKKTAVLPDYNFKGPEHEKAATEGSPEAGKKEDKEGAWPAVSGGTSISGLVGGLMTMFLAGLIGLGLKKFRSSRA